LSSTMATRHSVSTSAGLEKERLVFMIVCDSSIVGGKGIRQERRPIMSGVLAIQTDSLTIRLSAICAFTGAMRSDPRPGFGSLMLMRPRELCNCHGLDRDIVLKVDGKMLPAPSTLKDPLIFKVRSHMRPA
jgi:hypothetical protein